jgi:hypothetical protein
MRLVKNDFVNVFLNQLIQFGGLAFVIGIMICVIDQAWWKDIIKGEETSILKYSTKYSDNIYVLREFLLTLLFRVAPFLVPIVITTASFILNKYTGSFFNLLINDKYIRRLLKIYIFYFIFHTLVVLYTPSFHWGEQSDYFIRFFIFFIIDTVFVSLVIVFTVVTSIEIFMYTQPHKLSESFQKDINQTINLLHTKLYDALNNKFEVKNYNETLNQKIERFTNLTVNAIKSKDYNTIKSNINKLGNKVWINSIREPLTYNEEALNEKIKSKLTNDFRGFKGFLTPEEKYEVNRLTENRINQIQDETLSILLSLEKQIKQVYIDIYESAFSSKEFFACDKVIEELTELTGTNEDGGIPPKDILNIFSIFFRISSRYNYEGYTSHYCKRILKSVCDILFYRSTKEDGLTIEEYRVFYNFIKTCIEDNRPKILKDVLKSYKSIFKNENNEKVRERNYFYLWNGALYALYSKKMGCYADYIRFLVTDSKELHLDHINNYFSQIKLETRNESQSLMPSLDGLIEQLDNEIKSKSDDIFEIEFEEYLKIKCYVIFFSYYILQCEISSSRISENHHGLEVGKSVKNMVPLKVIKTLLFDLETHMKNWDKLFVSQSRTSMTETLNHLLDTSDIKQILQELEKISELKLANTLKVKLES